MQERHKRSATDRVFGVPARPDPRGNRASPERQDAKAGDADLVAKPAASDARPHPTLQFGAASHSLIRRLALSLLRWWPFLRGRWRLASLVLCGDLRGGPSFDRLIASIPSEVVRGRFRVAVRVKPESRYLSPYVFGDYEPLTSRIFGALLRRGDVAVDVGANYGWFTALFAQAVGPTGRVISFEPLPTFAAETRDTVTVNGMNSIVDLQDCGLGAREDRFTIYTFAGLPGGHASSSDLGRSDGVPHECRVVSLDRALEQLDVPDVHLMKVDVEGDERDVFLGAQALLRGEPGPIVYFEINNACLAPRGVTAAQVFQPLREAGYTHLWRIEGRGRIDGRSVVRVWDPSPRYDADYLAAKAVVAHRVEAAVAELGGRRLNLRGKLRRVRGILPGSLHC